ncbi:hypothetical protein [Amycolatopsis sacchari]|uniref:Uncharacterized protein n=1 Tax=Amycolatopsis sacchari TaxID=115433 RepID=A0A1I4CMU2_9PSEU|nr:hypothetical protein [Amycolatopsis sacchari]SFK82558.1 hypothetical protein SAMN05421835_13620 [Amycolatopsis sacchari]
MSRESGQDRSQKTVAELLALHGGNVEGRRRHRRAADEEEEQQPGGAAPNGTDAPRRARGATDTGPQAIIERVRGDNPLPPNGRRNGGRRALPDDEQPAPQDSGLFRPQEPVPPRAPQDAGPARAPEAAPLRPQDNGSLRPPDAPPLRPQETGAPRRPQDSAALPRPQEGSLRPPDAGSLRPQDGSLRPPDAGPLRPQDNGSLRPPDAPPLRPQDSATLPRPNGAPPSGAFPRPNGPVNGAVPPASGAFPQPGAGQPESGAFPRPPQESGTFGRPDPTPPPRNVPPESGAFPRPSGGPDSMPGRRPRLPQRPPQESGALPLPEQDEPRAARAAEETRQVQPLRRPPAGAPGNGLAARLDGLDAPAPEDTPDPGPPPSGAFPVPPRRPRRAPARPPAEPEPHTEQFQAVNGSEPPEAVVPPDAPPAGLSRWRRQREQVSSEDTEVGVMPAVREEQVPDEHLEATGFHDPFAEDDEEVDEFGEFGEAEPERRGGYDYEPDEAGHAEDEDYAEEAEPERPASPAKQWLSMAVQLALGVIGGAAVWLGFNWLWGQLPAAALVVALVVIVGLVWIVRKIRRADDIQTMVLAVLVGLVVTVSPAALLLLSR